MNTKHLHQLLSQLGKRRPVFHSEADFQHELAQELATGGFSSRIEKPLHIKINGVTVKAEVDLLILKGDNNEQTAIELKYVTGALEVRHTEESFNLCNNWGTNLSRFDCLADLQRVRAMIESGHATKGYTIFLTNVEEAWNRDVTSRNLMGMQFSIHEGRHLTHGTTLDWHPPQPRVKSVSRKRLAPYAPIIIPKDQTINWTNYSHFNATNNSRFRYLLLGA
jgi:hypothetical protein